jgi:hypothetical protein
MLLRAMPAPSTPEAQNLHHEAQALIEQVAVQQAESSVSRIRQQGSARDDGGGPGPEVSVHAGGATRQPTNQGRTPVRERILDTRGQAQDGDARNVINEEDLVLRLRQDNRGRQKLSPPWEGPYVVVRVLKPGTYKLANKDGEELTNSWNIQQLRRFYP